MANAATFTVDKAATHSAGACDRASDDCTLRDAVAKANASADPDTITFAAGLPTIELPRASWADQGDVTVTGAW